MRRFLFDSNSLNSLSFRSGAIFERAIREQHAGAFLGTGTPIAGEFLGGTLASTSVAKNYPKAKRLIGSLRIWPYDLDAAREYATLYAELKRKGITIQTIDLQAAAIARLLPDCTVVTCDSDFSHVPGLTVENWMATEPHA